MSFLLSHLLTESAARWPDREALRFQGQGVTYGQLDRLTSQLARTLRAIGVRRGDRVALYVHKSPASVIGIFGILKAGGVYVPLDPTAPIKRLAYITRNCDTKVLVSSTGNAAGLAVLGADVTPITTVVLVDGQPSTPIRDGQPSMPIAPPAAMRCVSWDEVQAQPAGPPPLETIEADLAYVLYTSGSTGDAKGVMISHRTILTFIDWSCRTFRLSENDRVTSHAPLHFDLSTFDIFATIKAGGTVVLVPERLSLFPPQMLQLLEQERVTVTYLVPSILSLMVTYGELDARDLSALRAILFAGEVFPIKYLRRLVAAIPRARYYNLYGPTETNVCTWYQVRPADLDPERTRPVPIGVACENIEVFAVNEHGQLVTGPGQEGELWVRGPCVAQGYWGDPERTARGFVTNPFQPWFQDRAYRTGDIVMLDDNGVDWLYRGRRDSMIKSRGYRVELGEIESALYGHEKVKEAAVIAVPDELVGNRIRAFVVPVGGSEVTGGELQAHCEQRLPRYMLPERIAVREELPKTSNGKIDRQRLLQG
jgi:amino acid adenylation domain-containing protein